MHSEDGVDTTVGSSPSGVRYLNAAPSPALEAFCSAKGLRAIDESALFDDAFYARASGVSGDRARLIGHYVRTGEASGLSPSEAFDSAFYALANPDVSGAEMNMLEHYLLYGRAEGRYVTAARVRADALAVERSGVLDRTRLGRIMRGTPLPGFTPVETYLAKRTVDPEISPRFDASFYRDAYEDVSESGLHPLVHYLNVGRRELRVASDVELTERSEAMAPLFDDAFYLAQLPPDETAAADPLRHYVLHGERLGVEPSIDFSPDYYVRRHPDIATNRLSPFAHYVRFGRAEGRPGRPDFSTLLVRGERQFDPRKKTIVVASHEASRTGAPLVGLMVGRALAERYNVIAGMGPGGSLVESFLEDACVGIATKLDALDVEYLLKDLIRSYDVSALLLNSVETCEWAKAALHCGIPTVGLLHEFAEYTLPRGRASEMVESVDLCVVPAQVVLESVQRELRETRGCEANNLTIRPQGFLPPLPPESSGNDLPRESLLQYLGISESERSRTKIVLGAGFVQMRKGVDLFVQTAAQVRALFGDDVRFLWVGAGYDPATDLQYSAWVSDMVRRLDLEEHLFFLGAQSNLDVAYDLCDVFYLSSRLDPFPNVALDVFKRGKPLVCFDRATGVAEHVGSGKFRGSAVSFCDCGEAAKAIVAAFAPVAAAGSASSRGNASRFDFAEYVAFIEKQLEDASAERRALIADADMLGERVAFDAGYHDGTSTHLTPEAARRSLLGYAARAKKGLFGANPRPGLSEGVRRHSARDGEGRAADTHPCVALDDRPAPSMTRLRIAVHLHLFYAALAAEFASALESMKLPIDVFVTTTSTKRAVEISYAFRAYKLGKFQVDVVENRGRDIAPFIVHAGPEIVAGGYDVVGHFHGKKSLVVDAGVTGDRWRRFLMQTLWGDRVNLLRVMELFAEDPNLGLVFAEDRHTCGWTKNAPIAREVAARLQPVPELPGYPIFPLGTMFWGRPGAFAPLWNAQMSPEDFPLEPLPYDGTIAHALERLLPAVCESTGHTWTTVHRKDVSW